MPRDSGRPGAGELAPGSGPDKLTSVKRTSTHVVEYTVLNSGYTHETGRDWTIDVAASPAELADLAEEGYLLRERLCTGAMLEQLRTALDHLEQRESALRDRQTAGERSWGFLPRHLMDKDPAFLALLRFRPVLSIAQAMMGPLVRVRGLTGRVSYPSNRREQQQTTWHRHLRVVSNPLPPWFSQPHCLDALIYLDDLNNATGPIAVLPGSHRWLDRDAPSGYEPLPGERVFRLRAGDAILMHGNLWHRALPTVSARRRMLILSYTPSWLRHSPHHGPRPEDGLTAAFLEDADLECRMLLGEGGYS